MFDSTRAITEGDLTRYIACRHIQAAAQGDLPALQASWQKAGQSWDFHAWWGGADRRRNHFLSLRWRK